MTPMDERVTEIAGLNPEALLLSKEYDEALIGWVKEEYDSPIIALYGADIVIEILQDVEGMTEEDAIEWYEYNIAGAYVGEGTPAFFPYDWETDKSDDPFVVHHAKGEFTPTVIHLFEEEE